MPITVAGAAPDYFAYLDPRITRLITAAEARKLRREYGLGRRRGERTAS